MAAASKEERQQRIIELLEQDGRVQVRDLAECCDVTEMTVRRDLDDLEQEGVLLRVHGGAILRQNRKEPDGLKRETSYMVRAGLHQDRKEELAVLAASLIQPGSTVFLDSGTTTCAIAQKAPAQDGCTYITNGVNVAMALLERGCTRVIVIGGEVDLNTWSSRGAMAVEQVRKLRFDTAFLACNAVSSDGAVMIGNDAETAMKRAVMQAAHRVYLTADSTKFDGYSLVSYAAVGDFDAVITDSGLDRSRIDRMPDFGDRLIQPQA